MRKSMNQHKLRWIALAVAAGIAALFVSVPDDRGSAQLSCDDPPIDVSRLSPVWDKTDFCISEPGVFEEIISGGVPRDGIPPIDAPQFESLDAAAEWLQPQSPVIAFSLEDDARAYPLAIMTRHEIVNDVVNGIPVAVTYCPLCNSAIVFDRRVDGETLRFGVSGLLRHSDLIMWDDKTQSWWQQFTGTGIIGTYTGRELEFFTSQLVSFAAFREQYPNGVVLARGSRSYGSNPYVGYDSSTQPFLFQGDVDPRLPATERVLAGLVRGKPIAYPFFVLQDEHVINDVVDGEPVVAFWQPGATSALDRSSIDESEDVGMAALYSRELDADVLTFTVDESGTIRDESTGSVWNVFGTAVAGELAGSQLRQILAAPHFWFAWAAFQPDTPVYGLDEK